MTPQHQTPETRAEAQVLALCQVMMECPCTPEEHCQPCQEKLDLFAGHCDDDGCVNCHGSGEAPRFPELRKRCAHMHRGTRRTCYCGVVKGGRQWDTISQHGEFCVCQGRGWLPTSIPEAAGVLRQREDFQLWLSGNWVSYVPLARLVAMLCDDHAVIAAACAWAGVEVTDAKTQVP